LPDNGSEDAMRFPTLYGLPSILLGTVVVLLPGLALAQAPASPPSPSAQPAAAAPAEQPAKPSEVLQHANALLMANKFAEAEAEFRRAEALAGGPCGECTLGLATVRASEGKWSESADLIQRSLPLLTAPALLARAYNQLGMALVKQGGAGRLTQAEEAMRNAVDYGGAWGEVARVNLAQILLLQERWAEAVPVAREAFGRSAPNPDLSKSARIILCQARSHLPDELQKPEEVLRVGGAVSRPEKIGGEPPRYTKEARLAKTKGIVILEGVIDREGCMRNPTVLKGLPDGLSDAAREALRLWVFSPALVEGKPVPVYYTLTTNFQVENDRPKLPPIQR
jgi:tetratricopeptide (TPR) repeat protein